MQTIKRKSLQLLLLICFLAVSSGAKGADYGGWSELGGGSGLVYYSVKRDGNLTWYRVKSLGPKRVVLVIEVTYTNMDIGFGMFKRIRYVTVGPDGKPGEDWVNSSSITSLRLLGIRDP